MPKDIPTARRVCPACVRREDGLIAPDCLVCAGTGVLELNRAALSQFSPQTVSRAVEIAIEAQARTSFAAPNPSLARARRDLVAMVERLRQGRILAASQPLPKAGPRLPAGVQWASTDRPLSAAHGALPHFSAAFLLCDLAPAPIPPPPSPPATEEGQAQVWREQVQAWRRITGPDVDNQPRKETDKGRRRHARRRRR